ncbi:MAG: DUF4743 domain-containing protein [Pelistega sp.]|nr:DUF4743 domain-containing protein [Pelistega sp.]
MVNQRIATLKKRLLNEIQQPPVTGSLPLYLNGVRSGTLHPSSIALLTRETSPYAYISRSQEHIAIELPQLSFEQRSDYFNSLAHHLRDNGLLPYWRDEQVNVWQGAQLLAHIERTATRPLGLLTQAIHMNAWTPDGQLFLSLRAPTKQTDPNKWDTIAGGLLNAADTLDIGLERETYEEAGVPAEALTHRTDIRSILKVQRPLREGFQYEEVLTSDCILAPEVKPQNMDGEVSEIRTFTVSEVIELMEDGMVTAEAMVVLLDSLEQNIFSQLQQSYTR